MRIKLTLYIYVRKRLQKLNKIVDLQQLLKEEKSLKESLYHNLEKIQMWQKVHLPIVPIVRKG